MLTKLKFFTVHNGHLFAMSENGTTFRTTVIGNTGWVRLTDKITGREPNDGEAYLAKQGVVIASASTANETITLVPAKEDEVLVLEPPQADEGGE